jgi:hypothetical protein
VGRLPARVLASPWPPAARIYNIFGLHISVLGAGLDIKDIHFEKVDSPDTKPNFVMIKLSGNVQNLTDEPKSIPVLLGKLVDSEHRPLQHWTFRTEKPEVDPQGSVPFSTKIEVPTNIDVRVVFTFTDEDKAEPAPATNAEHPEGEKAEAEKKPEALEEKNVEAHPTPEIQHPEH